MLKNTLLIALVIAIIYLYYHNKRLKGLPASADNSAPTEELKEKYSKQSRLLDEEQLENNKLIEKVTELEAELRQFKKDHEWPALNNSKKTKK